MQLVEGLDGVTGVTVDLAMGNLTVAGTAGDTDVVRAVTGVGYRITPA